MSGPDPSESHWPTQGHSPLREAFPVEIRACIGGGGGVGGALGLVVPLFPSPDALFPPTLSPMGIVSSKNQRMLELR